MKTLRDCTPESPGMDSPATPRIRILVADDHPVVRSGLTDMLHRFPHFEIAGEASTGAELIQLCGECQPDVVITDVRMPKTDGIAAICEITRRYPSVRCILLTQYEEATLIGEAIAAGAAGFLPKTAASLEELRRAVEAVCRNDFYFSHLTPALLATFRHRNRPGALSPSFTKREEEVLYLLCEGNSSAEVADIVCLSIRTIEWHIARMRAKVSARNLRELILYGVAHGYQRGKWGDL